MNNTTDLVDETENERNSKINLLQINLNKSIKNTNLLQNYIHERKVDIIAIQEPYIRGGHVAGFSKSFTRAQKGANAKVATIVTNRDIQIMIIDEYSDEHILTVEIVKGDYRFYNMNIYLPPAGNEAFKFTEKLQKINEIIHALKSSGEVMITADANSKSLRWGSIKEDRRGREWIEVIDANELIVVNEGNIPTFSSTNGHSIIDITIATEKLHEDISKWTVDEENDEISDHRPIVIEIESNKMRTKNMEIRYDMKKAKWTNIKDIYTTEIKNMVQVIESITDNNELDKNITEINDKIIQTINNNIPITHINGNKIFFWSKALDEEKRKVKNMRREIYKLKNQNVNPEDINYKVKEYSHVLKQYKLKVQKSRIENWKTFCSQASKDNPWGPAYKVLTYKKEKRPLTSLDIMKPGPLKTINEVNKTLLDYFIAEDNPEDDNIWQKQIRESARNLDDYTEQNDNEITEEEVTKSLNNISNRKKPGIDNITTIM